MLFWALDRFSREGTLATLQHLQRLSSYGVDWRSYQESYLDSCGPSRMSLSAYGDAGEAGEATDIRTNQGRPRARRAGKVLGRPRVEVDVKRLRAFCMKQGFPLRHIAAKTKLSLSTVVRSLSAMIVPV